MRTAPPRSPIDQSLDGPMVWRGEDLGRSTDWARPLSNRAIAELDQALRLVQRRGLHWGEVRKEDFPLPGLSAELAHVNRDLEWGRGVVLLRGLLVARYSEDELHII